MEATKQDQIAIAEMNLRGCINDIYNLCIRKRVFDKVGDKDSGAAIVTQLEKAEKMKDEYDVILKELKETK